MRLSVVIPLLNEYGNLRELHRRLVAVFAQLNSEYRLIFVDDGSTDGSADLLRELARTDVNVSLIRLSRNFGHEAASTAGLDLAAGDPHSDATILMDADLQDPPEMIVPMVEQWRAGHQIVYAVRGKRHGVSRLKTGTAWLFYRLINRLSDVPIPMDAGDFRLVDRAVLQAVRRCREQDRFVRGLVAWTGFKTAAVTYDRPARFSGNTKYNPLKLVLLSLDAMVGFSIIPLRMATALGFFITALSLGLVAVVILQKILGHQSAIQGYTLLATGLFFLGGVQMLLLGILGEYIGRIYRQSQDRPLYLIAEKISSDAPTATDASAVDA